MRRIIARLRRSPGRDQERRIAEIADVLDLIEYKPGWVFNIAASGPGPDCIWIQLAFEAIDTRGGEPSVQFGREWRVPDWATTHDIVKTALGAVLAAEEHEAKELFTYKGVSPFHPHMDVELLAGAAETWCWV